MGNLVGRSLAHFRIEGQLGEGGMGVVYRARDEKLGRLVALKVLPESFAANEERRRRFLREARSAAAITHACIATVYEAGEADGHVFIAMELVEGETLRARIEAGIEIAEAIRIAREIARGLGRAHEIGIVHRDLKPENVMTTPRGEVKILDFGLAKLREESAAGVNPLARTEEETKLTRDGRALGTPAYMSPEQAHGEDVDARTDIFSFGVLFFEMLTRERPFGGASAVALMLAASRDTPKRASDVNPRVPRELDGVVLRCLEKLRDARYTDGGELLDALGAVSEPSSRQVAPELPTESLLTTAAPPVYARSTVRWPWGIAAVAALAVAGSGLGWYARARGAQATSTAGPTASTPKAPTPAAAPTRMLDLPLPRSTNPDALLAYRRGRQDYHDASLWRGFVEMRRAVQLDPSLATALVTLLVWNQSGVWNHGGHRWAFSSARQLRDALSERDQALLDAVAPVHASDPPDYPAAASRFVEAAARFPGDAEVQVVAGIWLGYAGRSEDASAAIERAIAIDPSFAGALWARAAFEPDGDGRGFEACIAASPTAASCIRNLAAERQLAGECDAMAIQANRLAAAEPDFEWSYAYLLNALVERGGSKAESAALLAAMEASLRAQSRAEGKPEGGESIWAAAVAAHFGGFDEGLRLLHKLSLDAWGRERLSMSMAMESGDTRRAASEARAYAAKRGALQEDEVDGTLDATTLRLLQQTAGQSREEVAPLAIAWGKQDAARVSSAAGTFMETLVGAGAALSPAAAREATKALELPLPHIISVGPSRFLILGRALAAADRADDALPFLRLASGACGLAEPGDVVFAIARVQARLELAEVLAAKGETAEACGWLAKIEAQWGHATPRSVTAEAARAKSKALACPR